MENEKSTYRTNEVLNEILDIVKKGSSDEWLTIRQAVNYTKLSHQTLRRYIRKGKLKASKNTGRLLFKKSHLDKWLNG
jgi:excisionase family DNA binding protein|tara:strand:- start:295 stop:528 length:234 start_codon:yes stop_codon:yes gene_type:complete